MTNGFVIVAQNTKEINYVECAEALYFTIKHYMPDSNVTLISNNSSNVFENIIALPHGDLASDSDWKLVNDWQVYEASPYDNTIKIEADMICTSDIRFYFEALSNMDLCLCQTIRNYKGEISESKAYREFIIDNRLPDIYNGLVYFTKSETAKNFFLIVKDVFLNWEEYKKILICNKDEQVTTDWAYSIACHIMGKEGITNPNLTQFSFVHMKKYINDLITDNWTDELVYEFMDQFRIQSYTQRHLVHYQSKDFCRIIKKHYG
jgi:hypothetical protein